MKNESSQHVLNCDEIDCLDEIDDGSQLALVWCETHKAYEWHSIHLDNVQYGGMVTISKNPVFS